MFVGQIQSRGVAAAAFAVQTKSGSGIRMGRPA